MAEYVIEKLGPFQPPGLTVARGVRVYVPPRADGESGARPALFMFDGQNVFHDEPSYAGGWHLHRTVLGLVRRKLPAPVVIGIDHGGAARIEELSPWSSDRIVGRADALLDWIVGDIVPLIAREYGVATGPERVAIGGSSMGGLAAFYGHFRHPGHFGAALCISPSFWLGDGQIFDAFASLEVPPVTRIYLDAGAREPTAMGPARRMADALRARGYSAANLRWVADKRGGHSEADWRRRAPAALKFLFPP